MNEYKEEIEQLKLQANELLGDTSVLRSQIEKAISKARIKETSSLGSKLTRIEHEIYKLIDKIRAFTRDTLDKYVIEKVQRQMDEIKDKILDITKDGIDLAVNWAEYPNPAIHDAAGFWNVSSDPNGKGKAYLEKENEKVINTMNDLGSSNLQDFVLNKLKSQNMSQNTIGVSYDKNSSVASDITGSQEFRKLVHENKENLINNRKLQKKDFDKCYYC